jgi:uncharacterized protein YrzB (UPF0473 family)
MSFIYDDKDLINKLLNFGSEFEQKYVKLAQQAAPQNADKANLLTLLNNLEKEVGSNKPSLIDQKQQVDTVSNVFSAQGVASGQVPLSLIDMQTPQAFNHWMKRNNIEVTLNGSNYKFDDPEFDGRVVVTALHNRAKMLNTKATSDDAKNIYEAYIKQVEALAPSIEFQGKPTELEGTSEQTAANSGPGNIDMVMQELPFNDYTIDFEKIRSFMKEYMKLVSANKSKDAQNRVQAVTQANTLIQQAMAAIPSHVTSNMQRFPMTENVGPDQVKQWLQPGNHYLPLIMGLSNIITQTHNVVLDVAAAYPQADRQALQSQTDMYNRQLTILRNLQSRAGAAQ